MQQIARNGRAWQPFSQAPDADKGKLRRKRKEIWTWFIEVAGFRVLCTFKVALHGAELPSVCDVQHISPTPQAQQFAAEHFSRQFATSNVCNGLGSSGFGSYGQLLAAVYSRNVSTSTGTGVMSVRHKTQAWLHVQRCYDDTTCSLPASSAIGFLSCRGPASWCLGQDITNAVNP